MDNRTDTEKLTIIDERTQHMAKSIEELVCTVRSESKARSEQWLVYSVEHQKVVQRIDEHDEDIAAVNKDIGEINVDMTGIRKSIAPLMTWHKVLAWIAAFFGVSMGALLWGLITDAITLIQK